jgi:hypothetical protein
MSEPISEQIVLAVFEKLSGITGYEELYIERNRDAAVTRFPTLVLYDGDITVSYENTGRVENFLSIRVDGYVTPIGDAQTGTLINRLCGQIVQAVLADFTLGGLCYDIEEGERSVVVSNEEGQTPLSFFSMPFVIKYSTAFGDPFTLVP